MSQNILRYRETIPYFPPFYSSTSFAAPGGWAPGLIAGLAVVGLHLWKKNNMLSIVGGTVLYMALVQAVF